MKIVSFGIKKTRSWCSGFWMLRRRITSNAHWTTTAMCACSSSCRSVPNKNKTIFSHSNQHHQHRINVRRLSFTLNQRRWICVAPQPRQTNKFPNSSKLCSMDVMNIQQLQRKTEKIKNCTIWCENTFLLSALWIRFFVYALVSVKNLFIFRSKIPNGM